MPRTLVSDDGSVRVWDVTDDAGNLIGHDIEPIPTPEQVREVQLRSRAATALNTNRAFLALGSPSNAQVLAQVKALTRQVSALIRLELQALDDTA